LRDGLDKQDPLLYTIATRIARKNEPDKIFTQFIAKSLSRLNRGWLPAMNRVKENICTRFSDAGSNHCIKIDFTYTANIIPNERDKRGYKEKP
jgi:hypothetical protein